MKRLQNYLLILMDSLLTLFKVIMCSRKVKLQKVNANSCIVVGNAPSVMELVPQIKPNIPIFVVNSFVTMYKNEYLKLKPQNYVLLDPAFWCPINLTERLILLRDQTFDAIKSNTTWELTIYTATESLKYNILQECFKENKNINICTYNTTAVEDNTFMSLKLFLYKYNLAIPRPRNVLIFGLYLALNMDYKEVKLIGADSSWSKDLRVIDNLCYTTNSYYSLTDTEKLTPFLSANGVPLRVHELFKSLSVAFKAYDDISIYAKHKGVRIVNCTKESFIDAFERGEL